jgi:hypothetical protein
MPADIASWWAAVAEGATPMTGDAGGVKRGAVGVERGGLARPGLAHDDVDARTRRGERADHGLLIRVERWAGGEDLVDNAPRDARDASVLPTDGSLKQFGLCGQQVDRGVAALGLIDRADDAAGGVADTQQLTGGPGGGREDRDDTVVAQQPLDKDLDATGCVVGTGAMDRGT